jgi:hypothetical protein
VFIPDLRDDPDGRWPLFDDAVREVPARGLFVFPLLVNATRVGVLTLYRSAPGPLTDAAAHTATILAQVIAPELAQRILTPDPVDRANSADPNDRSEIYQATGVVMAQLELTPDRIRPHPGVRPHYRRHHGAGRGRGSRPAPPATGR